MSKVHFIVFTLFSFLVISHQSLARSGLNIEETIRQCQMHVSDKRLTTSDDGVNETAFQCYQKVLAVEPDNIKSKQGIETIEKTYFSWASRALSQGNLEKADIYISRLQEVNPFSADAVVLKRLLREVDSKKIMNNPYPTQSFSYSMPQINELVIKLNILDRQAAAQRLELRAILFEKLLDGIKGRSKKDTEIQGTLIDKLINLIDRALDDKSLSEVKGYIGELDEYIKPNSYSKYEAAKKRFTTIGNEISNQFENEISECDNLYSKGRLTVIESNVRGENAFDCYMALKDKYKNNHEAISTIPSKLESIIEACNKQAKDAQNSDELRIYLKRLTIVLNNNTSPLLSPHKKRFAEMLMPECQRDMDALAYTTSDNKHPGKTALGCYKEVATNTSVFNKEIKTAINKMVAYYDERIETKEKENELASKAILEERKKLVTLFISEFNLQ